LGESATDLVAVARQDDERGERKFFFEKNNQKTFTGAVAGAS
jgi:hypothetical protein